MDYGPFGLPWFTIEHEPSPLCQPSRMVCRALLLTHSHLPVSTSPCKSEVTPASPKFSPCSNQGFPTSINLLEAGRCPRMLLLVHPDKLPLTLADLLYTQRSLAIRTTWNMRHIYIYIYIHTVESYQSYILRVLRRDPSFGRPAKNGPTISNRGRVFFKCSSWHTMLASHGSSLASHQAIEMG